MQARNGTISTLAASLTILPLAVISAVAATFTMAGLGGLRRRDIGRI